VGGGLLARVRRPVLALTPRPARYRHVGYSTAALREILPQNFRVGSATFDQVRSWALPPRHVLAMLMPNFFGNPAEHTSSTL
jgi:hypothetical protein